MSNCSIKAKKLYTFPYPIARFAHENPYLWVLNWQNKISYLIAGKKKSLSTNRLCIARTWWEFVEQARAACPLRVPKQEESVKTAAS